MDSLEEAIENKKFPKGNHRLDGFARDHSISRSLPIEPASFTEGSAQSSLSKTRGKFSTNGWLVFLELVLLWGYRKIQKEHHHIFLGGGISLKKGDAWLPLKDGCQVFIFFLWPS